MKVEVLRNRQTENSSNIKINTVENAEEGQLAYDTSLEEFVPTEEDVLRFFDDMFPIGTVLQYTGEELPVGVWHFCDGEDGTVNMEGALIRGGTAYTGTVELSTMPNKYSAYNYGGANTLNACTGVMKTTGVGSRESGWSGDTSASSNNWGGVHDGTYYFDASRSNSVYKAGQKKVQPETTKFRFIVRVK